MKNLVIVLALAMAACGRDEKAEARLQKELDESKAEVAKLRDETSRAAAQTSQLAAQVRDLGEKIAAATALKPPIVVSTGDILWVLTMEPLDGTERRVLTCYRHGQFGLEILDSRLLNFDCKFDQLPPGSRGHSIPPADLQKAFEKLKKK